MSLEYDWLFLEHGDKGDVDELFMIAKKLEQKNELRIAATAYDRAFGLDPENKEIASSRRELLERLAITEHGIKFCYIPAGSFLMGSELGELDEQPVHPVRLDDYWLSETPITWLTFCELMDWYPPTNVLLSINGLKDDEVTAVWYAGNPKEQWIKSEEDPYDTVKEENKVRFEYCTREKNPDISFHPDETFDEKPMVAISWKRVLELTERLSTNKIIYRLPTEAEWEKAARGGLINCKYPWGDKAPSEQLCDFNRFEIYNFNLSILPMKSFSPNHYGLYDLAGSIWEWTNDWYDACYYKESPTDQPTGPVSGQEKVLRGGSWADCADAMTVSFRMSRKSRGWSPTEGWSPHMSPNIGFRLCRVNK